MNIKKLQGLTPALVTVKFKHENEFTTSLSYKDLAKCLEDTDIDYALVGEEPNLELVIIADSYKQFQKHAIAMYGDKCQFKYFPY